MKKYEVMYIINASVEEEKRAALIESLSGIITNQGGSIVKTEPQKCDHVFKNLDIRVKVQM